MFSSISLNFSDLYCFMAEIFKDPRLDGRQLGGEPRRALELEVHLWRGEEHELEPGQEGQLGQGGGQHHAAPPRHAHVPVGRQRLTFQLATIICLLILDANRNFQNEGLNVVISQIQQIKVDHYSVKFRVLLVSPAIVFCWISFHSNI